MANTTKFTIEGPMTLAYHADEMNSRRVLIHPKEEDVESDALGCCDESLESKIASEIGFPNDAEFDEVFRKMDQLREQGLRTEEGVPDGTREIQLRITVEVL
jgi:N-methylhydantoinase A/oxoprolinase/acetone carboxylase beta subunit